MIKVLLFIEGCHKSQM